MKECENFYASLSIRGFYEQKSRIHVSYSRHSRVCIDDKRIYMIAEDLEKRSWMSPDCYLMKSICWMRWKSYDSEIWTDHAEFVADDLLLKVFTS